MDEEDREPSVFDGHENPIKTIEDIAVYLSEIVSLLRKREPTRSASERLAFEAIDWHLRYNLPQIKWAARAILFLLALILWRIW